VTMERTQCFESEDTHKFLYPNGELTEFNRGEVCDDLENRGEVCCIKLKFKGGYYNFS